MGKGIVQCCICGEEEFYDGVCPNDIIDCTGYTQDDDDWSLWYCPDCSKYKKGE